MLWRIVGSLAILFSAIAIAKGLASESDVTLRQVSAIRSVLEQTKRQISCYALSAGEILRQLDGDLLIDCGYFKKSPPRDFSELACSIRVRDSESASVLSAFARDFGKSYRADELALCTLYIERIRAREQKLIKDFAKRKRVIYALAVCFALAVIILLA